ncbi:MAG TPA: DUF6252 family protein [Hanamia sp.]|nr:DUF6252 family protein [Hanamia sp.]
MKYKFILILTTLFFIILTANKCKKEPVLPEFYFRCKVNGENYRPDGCTNCLTSAILGDTTFLLGANRGYEVVDVGIIKLDHNIIAALSYKLDQNPQQRGFYKNSTTVTDRFDTDSMHIGSLQILSLDKNAKIISGIFSFQAYNPVLNKTVSITEGKFRLQYITD